MSSKKTNSKQKRFAPKLHIKKGDEVMIIAGSEKGNKGIVSAILVGQNRAVVEGRNMAKKHVKPQQDQPGGIQDMELPIHLSNLMLVDKKGVASRTGRKDDNGKLTRYFKKSGEIVK
ncbi:50S ribosomal protein L24 [Candidatus Brachybacter algidus]|jgi:large subunit ribosomal protein L24|uniref:50S ribosomal protein L24 n=1 Tax=Candidatus Brachybacter algidus TaxID=2982024 RepID=UPI001B45349E|nr:50S ribosomal protein L24 [Saprospiraceae bacterium]MBP7539410.1 50S ribosomal protein L24 [Saprospiraceae bacterium]MBP8891295.1 50S ribosomal protein L24 [Saprospiraceae bacterium]MBP9124949.1 50S ribosomal protein L24 [Saprospiraceae bacterium]MBP9846195.1 50S ribosomal protein L24 [Saprospiraceae bacterium]